MSKVANKMVRTGHITEDRATLARDAALVTPDEATRAEWFFDHLRSLGRRPNTLGAYRSDWQKLARWSSSVNHESFDLARMSGREIVEFRNHCLRLGQAPATVNRALVFLAEYSRWTAERRQISPEAARLLNQSQKVPEQSLAPRRLSTPELRRLLKEVDLRGTVRDKAVIYLLLYGGLRLGEVAQLDIGDITLSPRRGLVRIRSEFAKGGKERLVPLPAAARDAVTRYLSERGDAPGALFYGERGPLGRNGVQKVVRKYGRLAGIALSPHRLRHCFAYRYLEQTSNDLVGLAAILGHSSLNTTMSYTRKRLDDLQSAVEGLEFL